MKKFAAVAVAAVTIVGATIGSAREAEAQRGGRIALGIGAGLLGVGLLAGAGRYYGGYYGYYPRRSYYYRSYYDRPYYYGAGYYRPWWRNEAYYSPRWASYNWGGRQFLYERFHRHVYYGPRTSYRWRDRDRSYRWGRGVRRVAYYSYPSDRRYRRASFSIGYGGTQYWRDRGFYRTAYFGPRSRYWRGDRSFRRAYYSPRRGVRVRVRF